MMQDYGKFIRNLECPFFYEENSYMSRDYWEAKCHASFQLLYSGQLFDLYKVTDALGQYYAYIDPQENVIDYCRLDDEEAAKDFFDNYVFFFKDIYPSYSDIESIAKINYCILGTVGNENADRGCVYVAMTTAYKVIQSLKCYYTLLDGYNETRIRLKRIEDSAKNFDQLDN